MRIGGNAMAPTLNDGDRVQVTRAVTSLQRGELVAFYYPRDQSKTFVKRLIGLPGESVKVRKGQVLINDVSLEEPYVVSANRSADDLDAVVPAGEDFVLGDNRRNSSDSRHWGTVPAALIWGKVIVP